MDPNVGCTSDWAQLPQHLLDTVLEKLVPFSDYVRFSAVCVPWYGVAMDNRKKFSEKLNRQVPMLLFPKKDEEKEVENLYNIITKKFVNIEGMPISTRYGGSSRGWLISVGEDYAVTLTNLIYPGAVITLPPIPKNEMEYFFQIPKAILSADPTIDPHDYEVATIYGNQCQLAFIKPGTQDADWTYIDEIPTLLDDIIYYKGRLHAVDFKGNVFFFDDDLRALRKLAPTPHIFLDYGKTYLVESLSGDLLLVFRHVKYLYNPHYRNTVKFDVFKLNSGGPIWEKLESLDGESLFLGDNMSTSTLSSDIIGCCPNSIYFTDDFDSTMGPGDRGPLDSGVFNLESSSFVPHYVTDEASLIAMTERPPIWYAPNFLSVKPFRLGIEVAEVHNELLMDPRRTIRNSAVPF